MNQLVIGALVLGLLAGVADNQAAAQSGSPPTQYDQGNPTDAEQYLLLQLNRARMHPAAEGQRLAAWLRNTADGQIVVRQYGTNPSQIASVFASLPAAAPLAFDPDLLVSSLAHSNDLAAHGGVAPAGGDLETGYDGSTPSSRVQAAGFTQEFGGENVAPDDSSLDTVHASQLVDWGNPGLGHRKLSMDGTFGLNVVGIGVATISGSNYLTETEDYGAPWLVTNSSGVLATPNIPAVLTGVVYDDKNGNDQYDPGEGVAGVTISMDGGAYYAVTTASGGFSLPLTHADGSLPKGAVVVRMHGVPGESQDRTAVVQITSFASEDGPYLANVEWEAVANQPSAGVAAGPPLASFFGAAANLSGGWYYLAFADGQPFGYYNVAAYPYLFHDDLGWEYVQDAADGKGGVYFYDFASASWWYTSATFGFPYLYDFARHAVLYCYPAGGEPDHYSNNPRYFYDFTAKQVIAL